MIVMGTFDTLCGPALQPCELLSNVFRSSSYVPHRPTTHVDTSKQGGQMVGEHRFLGPRAEVQEKQATPSCPGQVLSPAGKAGTAASGKNIVISALIESK